MGDTVAVHDVSDLEVRGRAILDEARAGEVRLRDIDGFGLVMLPEQRVSALKSVLQAAANLLRIEHVLTANPARLPSLQEYGEWPWLQTFGEEDLREFLREMREALMLASREETVGPVEDTLYAWRVTAGAISDPARREILLGQPRYEDFVEVSRPE